MRENAMEFFDEDIQEQQPAAEAFDSLEGYVPSENEPYMNPGQVEYFRRKLLAWREELVRESSDNLQCLKEESGRETDFLDQGAREANATLKLRSRERHLLFIREIDAALERIQDGTYGYCEETGEEIGIKRLEARPIATLSIEAQEWQERRLRSERTWYRA